MARKILCTRCERKLYPRDFYPSRILHRQYICRDCDRKRTREAYVPKHKITREDTGAREWAPDRVVYDAKQGRLVCITRGQKGCHWSKQMLDDLRRYFPTTKNSELAGILGVSDRTMARKARELGLVKNREWLLGVWDENKKIAHVVNRRLGNSGQFKKGEHRPTQFQKGENTTEQVRERLNNTMS